ncbi:hypothetical protein GALL_459010 [mine drainage metagenome]|uniref:Uncharacterized protein n=1 Tax=mine drainage metagenome TaxID=410659 RepID=A0A1J5Q4S0_9ZZZZ
MNVVCLVVEHHQLGQIGQKLQHIAACVAPIQHLQAVAGGTTGRERQHGIDHLLRVKRRTQGLHVFHLIQCIALIEQMPIGDGNHAVAGGFQTNLGLAADVASHKGKHGVAVGVRDKQVRKLRNVGFGKVSRTIAGLDQLATKRVQQPLIHNQSRCHHHELAGKARIVHTFSQRCRFVEQLPDHQSL